MRGTKKARKTKNRRRRSTALLLWTVALAACSSGGSEPAGSGDADPASENPTTAPPAEADPPNIILVLTDDQTLADLTFMPKVQEQLVEAGATFDNAFVTVSLCCPSRATILRGQYAHNTGVLTNGGTNGGFEAAHTLGIEDSTVAVWLQEAGYRTALVGKYLNGYPSSAGPEYIPPGWDRWFSPVAGQQYVGYDYTVNDDGSQVEFGSEPADFGTDVYAGRAVEFVDQAHADDVPFFLYLSFHAPHGPATAAPRHEGLFADAELPRTGSFDEADVSDKPGWVRDLPPVDEPSAIHDEDEYRKRLASLQAVDDAVEALVGTLGENGRLDNTYIFFMSDNGYHLGEHRLPPNKQTAYEEDIHVPLVVRGPGVEAGTHIGEISGNVDLAPTFAALAGAETPDFVDGRSLVPLLHGEDERWRQSYLVEHWKEVSEPRPSGDATAETTEAPRASLAALTDLAPEYHGVRTDRYLYVEYSTGEVELYDMAQDPAQLDNLAGSADPGLLEDLSALVGSLSSCAGEECRSVETELAP